MHFYQIVMVAIVALILFAVVGSFMKNKIMRRVSVSFISLVLLTVVLIISSFILPNFLDTAGVWLSFAVCGGLFLLFLLLIWKPFAPKIRRIAALSLSGALLVLTITVSGVQIYQNSIPEVRGDEEINLSKYEPFREGTLAKSLGESSVLKLTDDLPRLDGATALYPLYSAFVQAVYPQGEYFAYGDPSDKGSPDKPANTIVTCSRTSGAVEHLIYGYVDVAFLMGVSDEQRAMAEAQGVELKLTPIGREAFVFFVNERNPVSELSAGEIKGIYSGKVTNWSEVGGKNDAITPYQRPENTGSQTALLEIMDGASLMPAPTKDVFSAMIGMYRAVADYKNYKNAFGYSFMFYINEMVGEGGVKLLSVDGAAPDNENIASGAYPFSNDFYAVTAVREGLTGEELARAENSERLIEWILSPQGQKLVEMTGYVPMGD